LFVPSTTLQQLSLLKIYVANLIVYLKSPLLDSNFSMQSCELIKTKLILDSILVSDPYAKSWFRATPVISADDGATDGPESYLDPSTYFGVYSPSVQVYIINPNRQPEVQPTVEALNVGFESDNSFGVVPEPATFTAEQTTGQIDDPEVPNFESRTSEQPVVEEVIAGEIFNLDVKRYRN
jgi:hypothetical protein